MPKLSDANQLEKLNIWGYPFGQAYDLNPGDSHSWIAWGPIADNGVVPWVSVKPFPLDPSGEKILEVTPIRHEAMEDGSRRIFYTVTNVGPVPVLAYAIYFAWTDVIK